MCDTCWSRTLKFKKDFLRWQQWDKTIYDKLTGHGRWSIHHECVFQQDGKFYLTTYSEGATESQDESPYDYDPDEIECPEVEPKEVTTTIYVELRPKHKASCNANFLSTCGDNQRCDCNVK